MQRPAHPLFFLFQRRATTPSNISKPQWRAAEKQRGESRVVSFYKQATRNRVGKPPSDCHFAEQRHSGAAVNPAVNVLSQGISNPRTQAQVQAIQNKINELINAISRAVIVPLERTPDWGRYIYADCHPLLLSH
jgi:hypothetical protein